MAHEDTARHPEPVVIVQPTGTIDYVNNAARLLLDPPSSDTVIGESILEYIDSSDRRSLLEQFERVDRGDASSIGLTLTVRPANGDSREFVVLNTAVEWNDEDRIELLFFNTNGTLPIGLPARTMDESPVGVSIADATHTDDPLIYVNDEFCALTGYSREEILGRNCRFLQGEATDEDTVAAIRDAIESQEAITTELRNYRKDGSMFWNRLSITPVESESGTVTHFLGFQEDVSVRKLYEHEKRLFEQQADATDQSIFITDREGTIEYVNPAFEVTTGYSAAEAIGKTPRILKSGHQDDEFYETLWGTITAGEVWEAELTNKRKSGELYRTRQKIVPVTNSEGDQTHFVAIEEDITDAQFIEQVLQVMDRVLRHNVRNSVTAIDGFATILEEDLDSDERRAAVGAIREHAEKLGKLSEETRTIRELFHRRNAQHSLSVETIEGFVETRREMHPNATIELSMDFESDAVVQNGSLLQLAIDETLENAIVHADRPEPHVTVSVEQVQKEGELHIHIADTGPGIPDDEWDAIVAGKETALTHGTGIGLWLIYWTVTALGGTMNHTENDPRGTILTLRVPLAVGEQIDQWNPPGE